MDFLKSAVVSAIAKGPLFNYTFGNKVDLDPSIWTLHNGTKREDGSNCSIFSFDVANNRSALPLAKNALKKLRTLRHPGLIKVLDTVETDSYIYIATERLVPLRWHVKRRSLTPETIKWGLYSVARAIKFINDDASSIHGNLKVASVYTSESGEWKLGGFEVLSNVKDDEAVIYTYGGLVPGSGRYTPPELARSGWDAIKKSPHSAVDSYCFGTLVFEIFNGSLLDEDLATQTKNVPPSMHSTVRRLTNANPKARVSVAHFLEQGMRKGAFFDNPLIKLTEGIDNLGVKSKEEREAFLDNLGQITDDFPDDFCRMKVLPELLNSVEFGGGGPKAFGIVIKLSIRLDDDNFDTKITPVLIRLFGNPDRAIRVCLLDSLPFMIDRLSPKMVNDKIFPQIVSGFTDLAPIVREQTLKSVLTLITKLSDRTINGELLKYLAKTANDEQPGIRTNTTICLGKIAKNLGTSSRAKVLIAAFTRSLRDPFVHARNAALMALSVTSEHFPDEDCTSRLLPAICPCLLDQEKLVRDQAFKTMDVYVQKAKKAAAVMPESVLPPSTLPEGGGGPRMSTPQSTAAGSPASWAGWAISSFTNKLSAAAGEIQAISMVTPPVPAAPSASRASWSRSTAFTVRPSNLSPASSSNRIASLKSSAPPSRTASSTTLEGESFPEDDSNPGADQVADAWADMGDYGGSDYGFGGEAGLGDGENDHGFVGGGGSTASPLKKSASATPFAADDGGEPDFAGWLVAQAQRKNPISGGSKALPKGLAVKLSGPAAAGGKSASLSTSTMSVVGAAARPKPVPAPVKNLHMKPKETGDDDEWGDGW